MVLTAANVRQQALMALGDMQHDGSGLEQGEAFFLIGRNLAERIDRQVRRLFQRRKRHQPHLIRPPRFLQRPTHPGVARQPFAAIG